MSSVAATQRVKRGFLVTDAKHVHVLIRSGALADTCLVLDPRIEENRQSPSQAHRIAALEGNGRSSACNGEQSDRGVRDSQHPHFHDDRS